MKTDVFPMSYFKYIWTPKQILKQQRTLNWFQIILLGLFLNGLMIIPVSLHYAKMEQFPIENTFPNAFELITSDVVDKLQATEFQSGQMKLSTNFETEAEKGIVWQDQSINEAEEMLKTEESAVWFLKDGFILKEKKRPAAKVPYTKDITFKQADTVDKVKDQLSKQWFSKNQAFVVAAFSFILYVLLLTELILLVFGSAFFIYISLKRKTVLPPNFKDAVSTVLYAAGVPTFAAMIIGLVDFNIILMISIQSIGMIGYMWVMYYQNRMEELKREKEQKALRKETAQTQYEY